MSEKSQEGCELFLFKTNDLDQQLSIVYGAMKQVLGGTIVYGTLPKILNPPPLTQTY